MWPDCEDEEKEVVALGQECRYLWKNYNAFFF